VAKISLAYEPEPEGLADGSWTVLPLVDIDSSTQKLVWKDGVQEAMPELTTILSNIPEFESCVVVLGVCDAYISRLTPGTHIKPHCGPTNLRIRTHLGIDVPEECFIRVADKAPSRMSQGGFFVFDDAYEHEVWNNGTRIRINLVVDIFHPGINDKRLLNELQEIRQSTDANVAKANSWEVSSSPSHSSPSSSMISNSSHDEL